MRDGFRIFDTHTHIGEALHSGRRYSAGQLLRDMDRCGVDRAVVIPFPVVADYRAAHLEIARAVRDCPDRLTGAACLSPFLPEREFRDEVDRCAGDYGFRAVKIQPQYQGLDPLSPRCALVFEAAAHNRMAVICHTGAGAPFALPSLWMLPARDFPGVPLVLAHAGGGLYAGEAVVAASFCPNIFVELSTLAPHQVAQVAARVPASRLMIGSDLPENVEAEIGKILAAEMPPQDRADILYNTALRVFCPAG